MTPHTLQLFLLLGSPAKLMVGQAMKMETPRAARPRAVPSKHRQHRGAGAAPPPLHTADIPLCLLQPRVVLCTASTLSAAQNWLFTKGCIPAAGTKPYNLETAWRCKAVLPSGADQRKIVSSDLCAHFHQVSTNIQNFSGLIECYST